MQFSLYGFHTAVATALLSQYPHDSTIDFIQFLTFSRGHSDLHLEANTTVCRAIEFYWTTSRIKALNNFRDISFFLPKFTVGHYFNKINPCSFHCSKYDFKKLFAYRLTAIFRNSVMFADFDQKAVRPECKHKDSFLVQINPHLLNKRTNPPPFCEELITIITAGEDKPWSPLIQDLAE